MTTEVTSNTPTESTSDTTPKLEGFNIDDFGVREGDAAVSKRVVLTVPVCKPNPQNFFRTLSGVDDEGKPYVKTVYAIVLKDDMSSTTYIVTPEIADTYPGEIKQLTLYVCYNQKGAYFIVPVPQPEDGDYSKWNKWHETLTEVLKRGMEAWVRCVNNDSRTGKDYIEALKPLKEPKRRNITFNECMKIAFKDRVITDENHPLLKKLLGDPDME
jgi:hypothetical protein